jgi:chemotaxis protein MotB
MRRRRLMEEPSNHDRWLVSYSDFITVLFALFVVLFATSYRDSQAVRNVSHAIHVGFQQLGAFQQEHPDGLTVSSTLQASSTAPVDSTVQVKATDGPLPIKAEDPTVAKDTLATGSAVDIAELRSELEAAIGDEIRNQEVVMRVTPEGFVVSLKDMGFFNSGQAVLMPGASGKIRRIAAVLTQHGLDLRVEGHSDDQPIHTAQFRSNWELSTARAMAVLMLLVDESGMDPTKISVAGYGQYRPIAVNSTPEGRQMNRRVDLVVVAPGLSPQQAP